MKNDNRQNETLLVSKVFTIMLMGALVIILFLSPQIIEFLLIRSTNAYAVGATLFFITFFVGAIPVAAILVIMYLLLHRISKGEVFVKKNVTYLKFMSLLFHIGAIISFLSGIYYGPWVPIGVAAIFMALVIRVIKNVIEKAISLQDDVDHTI